MITITEEQIERHLTDVGRVLAELDRAVDVACVAGKPVAERMLIAASEISDDLVHGLASLRRVYHRAAQMRPLGSERTELEANALECRRLAALLGLMDSFAREHRVSLQTAAAWTARTYQDACQDPDFSPAGGEEVAAGARRAQVLADHLATEAQR